MASIQQPFGQFPHVILLHGEYKELCCPICGGNARRDRPYNFFDSPKAFVMHVTAAHKESKTTVADLVNSTKLRDLTTSEVQQIQDGDGTAVITKIRVANKPGGSGTIIPYNEDKIPIPLYPTVIKLKDNSYLELRCIECNGNARVARGSVSQQKLVFIQGAMGLASHIHQAHAHKTRITDEWVVKQCGVELGADRVEQLKEDHTGQLINKDPVRNNVKIDDQAESAVEGLSQQENLVNEPDDGLRKVLRWQPASGVSSESFQIPMSPLARDDRGQFIPLSPQSGQMRFRSAASLREHPPSDDAGDPGATLGQGLSPAGLEILQNWRRRHGLG